MINRLLNSLASRVAAQVSANMPNNSAVIGAPPPATESTIPIDYPPHPRARYGYGLPAHPELCSIIGADRERYRQVLDSFAKYREQMIDIPTVAPSEGTTEPSWINGWLPGLDSLAIYGFIADRCPKHYVEVGSGNSTKFARRAMADHGLATRITSIDPAPRAEIDRICDVVLRSPLEEADLTVFLGLEPGDIVFIDNSHRSFQNSDVTVFFLEVLPRLPAGVLVGIHDICLPFDYPPDWLDRYYSEQYLLGAFLLGGHTGFELTLPSFYASVVEPVPSALDSVWADGHFADVQSHGCAFWMTRV